MGITDFGVNFNAVQFDVHSNKPIDFPENIRQFVTEKTGARPLNVVFNDKVTKLALGKQSWLFVKDEFPEVRHHIVRNGFRETLKQLAAQGEFFILHSAGIIIKGKLFIFCGPSRAGKTTISEALKDEGAVLNEDFLVIYKKEDEFYASALPEIRPSGLLSNLCAPIHQFFFIEKSTENQIAKCEDIKARVQQEIQTPHSRDHPIIQDFLENFDIKFLKQNIFNKPEFLQVIGLV